MSRLVDALRHAGRFVMGVVRDPQSADASSSRVVALVCGLSACGVAWYGAVHHVEYEKTVAALLGGGVGGLLSRVKGGGQ